MEKDYKKLGFKCGLEIHQQLEGRKLFCNCPTIIRKDKSDFEVKRKLRASAGELGNIDIAALHELQKGKYFVYQGYNNTTCLVELDEEPPHEVNMDALRVAIQVAKLLNADVVDEIQFMRKVVIDGSNVSGFQRTALIALNGFVEVNNHKIKIPTICLEEDACQAVERTEKYDVYNLSRLGIPLIEIATDSTIESPEECKEVAAKIGMILRSVKGIKRGIGSIRQDVNISITNGARTEIKGFQEYKSIPKVIDYEIERQLKLIKQGKKIESEVRNAKPDFTTEFLRPMPGADRMYPETDVPTIRVEHESIEKVELIEEKAKRLEKIGLSKDLANKISKSSKINLFEALITENKNIKPAYIAEILVSYEPELARNYKGSNASLVTDEHFKKIFSALNKSEIAKEALMPLIVDIAQGKELDLSKHSMMSDVELEKIIKQIVEQNKGTPFNALIGRVMAVLRGKADAKKIIEIINRFK